MPDLTPDEQRLLDQWLAEQRSDGRLERDMEEFGLRPRRRGSPYRRPPRPKGYDQPPSEMTQIFMQTSPDRKWAETHAKAWGECMFTAAEVRGWLGAGVGSGEHELAWELRSVGLTPELVKLRIRGDTVMERIRGRQLSLAQIVGMLIREGHMVDPSKTSRERHA